MYGVSSAPHLQLSCSWLKDLIGAHTLVVQG